jgi:hypothetical protein
MYVLFEGFLHLNWSEVLNLNL